MNGAPEGIRQALGTLATNVVVISVAHGPERHGCIANVWGEETDPPLVACALSGRGRTFGLVTAAGHFGVSVLGAAQAGLVARFSGSSADPAERFGASDTFLGQLGDPLLAGSLATFECHVARTAPFGRQTIVVGEVAAVHQEPTSAPGDPRPLLYARSQLWAPGEPLGAVDWGPRG